MRLETDLAQMLDAPDIAGLDPSALAARDVMNIVLQRSEVLFDLPRPGRVVRAWTKGDAEPLAAPVAQREDLRARRAEGQLARLRDWGAIAVLPGPDRVSRVVVRRGDA